MSVASSDIIKLLSDLSTASDKIAEEFRPPPLSDWISVLKRRADTIAESESSSLKSGEVPTLMSYIGTSSKGPRVSTVLTEIERRHLHRNAKVSMKSARGAPRLPLRRSSTKVSVFAGNVTPKLKIPSQPSHTEQTGKQVNYSDSSLSIERKEATPLQTLQNLTPPVFEKEKDTSLIKDRSSKRKSSPREPLVLENKKPKTNDALEMKMKLSSNIKSSVGGTSVLHTFLKENRVLRSNLETKQDTAAKNRMAFRQQKLEQNKKIREEKIKLAKEKQELIVTTSKFLRSGQEKAVKTPKKAMQKTTSDKSSSKKDKPTSVKKIDPNKKSPTFEISKGNKKTPVKKNPSHETEKKKLNATFDVGVVPQSNLKAKILKQKNKDKTPSTPQQKKQLIPSQKKGPDSYAITPARSSFVSYDISEIRSDSEEEEQDTSSKPIPSWATGVRLRNALLQQHHHPIDTDELFGNTVALPDLTLIMGVSKQHYKKRTSSAVWNSSFS